MLTDMATSRIRNSATLGHYPRPEGGVVVFLSRQNTGTKCSDRTANRPTNQSARQSPSFIQRQLAAKRLALGEYHPRYLYGG